MKYHILPGMGVWEWDSDLVEHLCLCLQIPQSPGMVKTAHTTQEVRHHTGWVDSSWIYISVHTVRHHYLQQWCAYHQSAQVMLQRLCSYIVKFYLFLTICIAISNMTGTLTTSQQQMSAHHTAARISAIEHTVFWSLVQWKIRLDYG